MLAAGYGTRLYPLTVDTPKPLLKIGGRPMIEHILDRIVNIPQINEVVIVSNNKFFHKFMDWLRVFSFETKLVVLNDGSNSNEDRRGAVGDILFAVDSLKIDDDLLVIAGDNLFEFSLLDFSRYFAKKGHSAVALRDLVDKSLVAGKFGVALIDGDSRVISFEEKPVEPKSSLASTACYFFTRSDVSLLRQCIAENNRPDNLGDFIKWLISRSSVYGYVFNEKWFDIGSHDQLGEAEAHWSRKQ